MSDILKQTFKPFRIAMLVFFGVFMIDPSMIFSTSQAQQTIYTPEIHQSFKKSLPSL